MSKRASPSLERLINGPLAWHANQQETNMPVDSLMEKTINRNLVKYAVQRVIFCSPCGSILDMRKAVLVTAGEGEGSMCLCGACWDQAKDHVMEKLPHAEALDGRELWKRRKRPAPGSRC